MPSKKEAVAISSMIASSLMTVGKFTVGLMTGSLGLISEGLHSLLDFGATIITYFAVRISDKPADADHHYGHGKAESIAALAETGLLFITSAWIVYEAIDRLLFGATAVTVTWWSIAVVLASIVIDISRARALKRVAKETNSQALEADALHFSSDVLSSAVVLVGLVFVWLGWPKGDAVAAIGVSLFVCHAGWVLGRNTIDALIDAAPDGVSERIVGIAKSHSGVASVNRVRVRPSGGVLFAEIDISVSRGKSFEQVEGVRSLLISAVKKDIAEAEVTVSAHPLALDNETLHERIMAVAKGLDVYAHNIVAHKIGERLSVSFDIEVPANWPLRDADAVANNLENCIRDEFGSDIDIEVHIDPLHELDVDATEASDEEFSLVQDCVNHLVRETNSVRSFHGLRVQNTRKGKIVIFHCTFLPETTVGDAHETVEVLERKVISATEGTWRVVVHAEPYAR